MEVALLVGIADLHRTLKALIGRQFGHHSVTAQLAVFRIRNNGAAHGLKVVFLAVVRVIVVVQAVLEEGFTFF